MPDLLDFLSMWLSLAAAYVSDPAGVFRCWLAYLGGDERPLRAALVELEAPRRTGRR